MVALELGLPAAAVPSSTTLPLHLVLHRNSADLAGISRRFFLTYATGYSLCTHALPMSVAKYERLAHSAAPSP